MQDVQSEEQAYSQRRAEIVRFCKENDCPWEDPDFPADDRSLYKDLGNKPYWAKDIKTIRWMRPQEVKDAKLFVDKKFEAEFKKGFVGETWFMGALMMLTTRPEYLYQLIYDQSGFELGFMTFQFFVNGAWKFITIDTRLPFDPDTKQMLFSHSSEPNEFWISLVEKAYAKLIGCYESILRSKTHELLVDLTAGTAEKFNVRHPEVQKLIEEDAFWHILMAAFREKFFIMCENLVKGRNPKAAEPGHHGILENHAYGVIDIREFPKENNLRLIRIRNVWGSDGAWTGDFSDESEQWDKRRDLRDELKLSFKSKKSDGTWWMAFQDWCENYNHVYICKVPPEKWETYSIDGKWEGKSFGGRIYPCSSP